MKRTCEIHKYRSSKRVIGKTSDILIFSVFDITTRNTSKIMEKMNLIKSINPFESQLINGIQCFKTNPS